MLDGHFTVVHLKDVTRLTACIATKETTANYYDIGSKQELGYVMYVKTYRLIEKLYEFTKQLTYIAQPTEETRRPWALTLSLNWCRFMY